MTLWITRPMRAWPPQARRQGRETVSNEKQAIRCSSACHPWGALPARRQQMHQGCEAPFTESAGLSEWAMPPLG